MRTARLRYEYLIRLTPKYQRYVIMHLMPHMRDCSAEITYYNTWIYEWVEKLYWNYETKQKDLYFVLLVFSMSIFCVYDTNFIFLNWAFYSPTVGKRANFYPHEVPIQPTRPLLLLFFNSKISLLII